MLQKKPNSLVVSVVSHGHGPMVQALLHDLACHCATSVHRVVLTLNVPEQVPSPPTGGWPFVLQVRRNAVPLGFGANHNQALVNASEDFIGVLNPDVRLHHGDPFAAMVEKAASDSVCSYALQVAEDGSPQACERELPTLCSLLRRRLWGRGDRRVDWVNAACLVLPTPIWETLQGFDEAYFMYCEDVDLCLRARLAGVPVSRADAVVEHAGQRASSKDMRHLAWHVRSLIRLWCSPVFWRARYLLQGGGVAKGRIDAP